VGDEWVTSSAAEKPLTSTHAASWAGEGAAFRHGGGFTPPASRIAEKQFVGGLTDRQGEFPRRTESGEVRDRVAHFRRARPGPDTPNRIKEKRHGIGNPIIETSRVLPQTSSATIVSSISWSSLLPSENRR
jgi:hypothetical protein